MKKLVVCLLVVVSFAVVSCKSTAPAAPISSPELSEDPTQGQVNDALNQIYDTYRGKLDLTGAGTYTVVSNDTLSGITRKFYGTLTGVGEAGPSNGFYFPVIMLASENDIVDPDLIEPGMSLKIPDLTRNLNNPAARQAIIDCLKDVAYVYNRKGKISTEEGLLKLANSL